MLSKKIDQTRHIVYCPHIRLASRQPNDVTSVLAGPLNRRLAGLICTVHPTGCTTAVVEPAVKCRHRNTVPRISMVNVTSGLRRTPQSALLTRTRTDRRTVP